MSNESISQKLLGGEVGILEEKSLRKKDSAFLFSNFAFAFVYNALQRENAAKSSGFFACFHK